MLIGEFIHTIDDKNRVALPAKFRKDLGKTVVLAPGLDRSIFMLTLNEWKKVAQRLSEGSFLQSDNRSFNRFIFGGAVEVDVDAQGRVLIPEFLAKRAGLKSKVALIGVDSRVEIWNEKTWNEYKQVVELEADQLAEKLGQVGIL
ncbi:MAG: division/cell wall cluster transcriptional repressor MraZ [Candidatus Pacebacteria bacterium]|jgi:MraZ protein|nr:division/cell wall cluster transcriptional repressor MraZ [Candidatus Paceibacterota bacterium]MBP9058650.1 division/cell wall cluster transcriptional repressor MraZ [Candidatus Paceibacterota bacterium]MBP9770398.1 division/cell wall cluster transcriptional repressor MraZ [Candidatus Paceibacterota bacterium]